MDNMMAELASQLGMTVQEAREYLPQFVEHYGRAAITQCVAELIISSAVAVACVMVIVWSIKEIKNMTKDERLFRLHIRGTSRSS